MNEVDKNETKYNDNSFMTSTPRKGKFQCKECEEEVQCVDCFVMHYARTGSLF